MTKYFNLHTHSFTHSNGIVELVNQYPSEFNSKLPHYSIGIHPWHIDEIKLDFELKTIEEKLNTDSCLALGECGLDKRIELQFELQILVFKKQLKLLQNTIKPVILHCVAAFQEVVAIKKEMQLENTMIIHGFSKNKQVAQSLLDNGFYLSFGKYLMQNPDLELVFKNVPNNQFFLETDSSNYTIEAIYEKAAQIKECSIEEMKQMVATNFERVFKNNLDTI